MRPTYEVRAWQEDGWWLARVVGASDGADATPLNALTQARALTRLEQMARDLVATILDEDEGSFEIAMDYVLPDEARELVCQASGARAWLDAAQQLWQERSVLAARSLAAEGYSLRETATLLGLSHQRVDQLLGGVRDSGRDTQGFALVADASARPSGGQPRAGEVGGVDVFIVVRRASGHSGQESHWAGEMDRAFTERTRFLIEDLESRRARPGAFRDEVTATRNDPRGPGATAGGNSIRHACVIWDA